MSAATPDPTAPQTGDAPASSGSTPRDRAFGVVAGVALLLAVLFFLRGGAGDTTRGGVADPPPITLLEPADGAVVSGSLALVLRPGGELRQTPAGWTLAGRYHLHALVDETELMAGPQDVQPLGGGRYRWTLPSLPAGGHRLVVRWSGPDHRPLRTGESAPVVVTVR